MDNISLKSVMFVLIPGMKFFYEDKELVRGPVVRSDMEYYEEQNDIVHSVSHNDIAKMCRDWMWDNGYYLEMNRLTTGSDFGKFFIKVGSIEHGTRNTILSNESEFETSVDAAFWCMAEEGDIICPVK